MWVRNATLGWSVKTVIPHARPKQCSAKDKALINEINGLVELCIEEKDYTTHNFLQWYVAEQIEEETLARNIIDKLKLIGEDKGGMYLFDWDLQTLGIPGQGGRKQKGKKR